MRPVILLIAFVLALGWSTDSLAGKGRRSVDNLVQHWLGQKEGGITGVPIAPSIAETENFAIYYLPHQFPDMGRSGRLYGSQFFNGDNIPDYIGKLMVELEFAYGRIKDMGYPEPSFAKNDLISVFVVAPERVMKGASATVSHFTLTFHFDNWPAGEFVTLPNNLSEGILRGTAAHEVFHLFQDSTRFEKSAKLLWLWESTAVWAEDEVHPPTDYRIGFPLYLTENWWREWGKLQTPFVGLDDHRDHRNNAVWYASGVLFKWWTENLPGGRDIVREVLGKGLRLGNAKKHLQLTLEKHAPPGKSFPDLFLDASLASYLQTGPAPYALKRGDDANHYTPRESTGDPYNHDSYDSLTGEVGPETVEIPSFAAYFQRIPAERTNNPADPKPLFVAVALEEPETTRFAVVETSSRLPDKRRVTLLKPGTYVIPRFANDLDETVFVDVAAVNGALSGVGKFDWAFSAGGPPVLETVVVEASGHKLYEAHWKRDDPPDKVLDRAAYTALRPKLEVVRNAMPPDLEGKETLSGLVVHLSFSQPVRPPEVRLGDQVLTTQETGERREWYLRADSFPLSADIRQSGKLALTVNAWNGDGMRLDAEPGTPAMLKADARGWFGYEGHEDIGHGGEDRSHIINIAGEPAYLKKLTFRMAGKVYYEGQWEPSGEGRALSRPIDIALDPEVEADLGDVELVFSKPVALPSLTLSPERVDLVSLGEGERFSGTVSAEAINRFFKWGKDIAIGVVAEDWDHRPADAKPETLAARYPKRPIYWVGYERGVDTSHRIKVGRSQENPSLRFSAASVFGLEEARAGMGDTGLNHFNARGYGQVSWSRDDKGKVYTSIARMGGAPRETGSLELSKVFSDCVSPCGRSWSPGVTYTFGYKTSKPWKNIYVHLGLVPSDSVHSARGFMESARANHPYTEPIPFPGYEDLHVTTVSRRGAVPADAVNMWGRIGRMTVFLSFDDASKKPMGLEEVIRRAQGIAATVAANLENIKIDGGGSVHKPLRSKPLPAPEAVPPFLAVPNVDIPSEAEREAAMMKLLVRTAEMFDQLPPEQQREMIAAMRAMPPDKQAKLPPSLRARLGN